MRHLWLPLIIILFQGLSPALAGQEIEDLGTEPGPSRASSSDFDHPTPKRRPNAVARAAEVPPTWGSGGDGDESSRFVEIEFPATVMPPLRERRASWQITFSAFYESLTPKDFVSLLGDGLSYPALFGQKPVQLVNIALGGKFNLPVIGIDIQAVYGAGMVGDDQSGQPTGLNLTKKGLRALAVIDGLLQNSYIAPYVGMQFVSFDVSQQNTVGQASATTPMLAGLQAGLLISLNWVESEQALHSYNNHGLTNTYLDVAMQNYPSGGGQDPNSPTPNLATGMGWSLGMKLEF
ncbi:MAG: hypothetical protein C5B49_01760 [Bdellovibrio sp.]|nr:MAG: hypothetical protein C5B49_01760 [Bdellovibrio sp.]